MQVTLAKIALAEYYVAFSENILGKDMQGALRAEYFLQKAYKYFIDCKCNDRAIEVHRRLNEVQAVIPAQMHSFFFDCDLSSFKDFVDENMKDLSFKESIVRITQLTPFAEIEKIRQEVITNSPDFTRLIINASGQTMVTLPPLNSSNQEINQFHLELHMLHRLSESMETYGSVIIKEILLIIKNRFTFSEDDLCFLTDGNSIIPPNRAQIIRSGIMFGLQGKMYEALHILAPQTEAIFRLIAQSVGAITDTLNPKDGTSEEKTLSNLFSLPEMCECYENEILFTFRCLLTEKLGGNIRNNVAHGILEPTEAESGIAYFFLAALIKLLSLTSPSVYKTYAESERLHDIIGIEDLRANEKDNHRC